jgi:hypothetical protein
VPIVIARSAFLTGTTVLGHDNLYWAYPVYHFFASSLDAGRFPLWNPFVHGGEPFLPLLLHVRLLDPVSYVVLALGRLLTGDVVLLFNWDRLARALVAAFGGYLLIRGVATHWIVRASLAPLLCWSSFVLTTFQQAGIIDSVLYAPFVAYFLLHLVHGGDTRWVSWIGLAVFVGMSSQSVFYVGIGLLLSFVVVGFLVFDRGALRRLVVARDTPMKATVAFLFVAALALPSAVALLEQSQLVFPARMLDHAWAGQLPRGAPALWSPGPGAEEFTSLLLPYGVLHYTGTFVAPTNFVELVTPWVHDHVRVGPTLPHRGFSDSFMYIGALGYLGAVFGLVAGHHPLKRVWLAVTLGFGLLLLGPSGGLHWALQFFPPVRAVRHTSNLVGFFVLGLVFFFALGANRVAEWATSPSVPGADRPTSATARRRAIRLVGAIAASVVLGGLLARYLDWTSLRRPVPFWPWEALLILAAAMVVLITSRWLGSAAAVGAIGAVHVVTAVANVLAANVDPKPTVIHLLLTVALPVLALSRVRRLRPSRRHALLLAVAGVLLLDLAVYFHRSSAVWAWTRLDRAPWVVRELRAPDVVAPRLVTLPVTLFPYVQAVRYLPLVAQQPTAFDGVLLPIGAREGYFASRSVDDLVGAPLAEWHGERRPGSVQHLALRLSGGAADQWLWARLFVQSPNTVYGAVGLEVKQGNRAVIEPYRYPGALQALIGGIPLSNTAEPVVVNGHVSSAANAPAELKGLSIRIGPGEVVDPRRFDADLIRGSLRWNTLAMPRRYHQLIHGGMPTDGLLAAFAVHEPIAQFRPHAADESELLRLVKTAPRTVAERLRTTVFLASGVAAAPATSGDGPPVRAARVTINRWDGQTLDAEVDTPVPGYLYMADGYDPHWRATVDGHPAIVLRANAGFKAVAVPAGRHRIGLAYRPTAIRLALWAYVSATVVGLGIVIGGAVRAPRRRRDDEAARQHDRGLGRAAGVTVPASGTPPAVTRTVDITMAGVSAVLGAFLAVWFFLHAGPLWRDEVDTVNLAGLPAGVLWSLLGEISMPPAYPMLLGLVTRWADTDAAIRAFGLATAVTALAVLWIAGRTLTRRPPALALAIFATNAVAMHTASSVTVYAAGTIWVMATAGAMWALARAPGPTAFVVAAATSILAVQMQYQNALHVAAIVLAAAGVSAWAKRFAGAGAVLGAGALAALSLGPYAASFSSSRAWRMLARDPLTPNEPLVRFVEVFSVFHLLLMAVQLTIVAAAGWAVVRLWSGRMPTASATGRATVAYAALVAVFGMTFVLVAFAASGPAVQPRHLVGLMALVALSLDVVAGEAFPRWMERAAIVTVVAVGFPVSVNLLTVRLTNVDLIARHLEASARPGDLIVSTPWFIGLTLERYYRGPVPRTSIPPLPELRHHRYRWILDRMTSAEPLAPLHTAIARTLEADGRVWFVGALHFLPPDQGVPALPRAPAAPTQWFDVPYYVVWSAQTGDFVRRHAQRWYRIEVSAPGPVSTVENPSLLMVEGWTRAAATTGR